MSTDLNIYAVSIFNFKSYKGTHFFEFPNEPGVYFFTGRNEHNPRLGANGCGKTSLIDAIEWCLFGKTSRGLKAGDIISYGEKRCHVATTLQVGEDEVTVMRSQNPNKIFINDAPANEDELKKLLRINQEAFNCSIMLPQFGESFFDLTPTRKLVMFSQVMNLDYWLEKSKLANNLAAKLDHVINNRKQELAKNRAIVQTSKSHIAELKKADADKKKKVLENLESLVEERENLVSKTPAFEQACNEASKKAKKAKKAYDLLDIAENNKKITNLKIEKGKLETTMQHAKRSARNLKNDLDDMLLLKNKKCPVCKQKVDVSHVSFHKDDYKKKIKEFEKALSDGRTELENIDEEVKSLNKKQNEKRALAQEAHKKYKRCIEDHQITISKLKRHEREIKDLDDSIYNLKNYKSPFLKMIEKAKAERQTARKSIAFLKGELSQLNVEHEATKFWVQGFKRLRLYVLEEALINLEIEINNHLLQLGLVDYKIELDIERENKSGGVTKGFTVLIHSPKHDKPIKWESFSGGEIQRLRMAGNLGLSNLILNQAGLTSLVEMIDEPSQHLSNEGIEDLVETLGQRAKDFNKCIWLVDHRVPTFGSFAGVLTAVMDKSGSTSLEMKQGA